MRPDWSSDKPLRGLVLKRAEREGTWALVHKYTQPSEFITFFDLTQKNVTC